MRKMDQLNFTLSVIAFLILVVGFVYTIRVAKNQRYQRGEYDTQINEKVQVHPYTRNPVFIAYLIFIGLVLAYIIYLATTSYW
jgi:energy-converting hydrogenase Eha subunit F